MLPYSAFRKDSATIDGMRHNCQKCYGEIRYKGSAREKGLEFTLTSEEFFELVNGVCYFCGGEGYGIDRLDSSVGYKKENCVSCCTMCNLMKLTNTVEDFVEKCRKITNNFKK